MNRILSLVIVSGFCGGSVYPLIKIAEHHSIPSFAYIFWESSAICFFLLVIAGLRSESLHLRREEFAYYLFCAFTNIIISQSLFFTLAKHLPASVLGIICVLTPILVYLATLLFFGESPLASRVIGLALGFLGTALLFLPGVMGAEDPLPWFWLLFSLLLPLNYSINRLFATHLRPAESSNSSLTLGLFLTVALISLFAMLLSDTIYVPFSRPNPGDYAILLHAVLMTVFYLVFFALARSGAVENSLSFYVTPLVALGWGVLAFEEKPGISFALASVLVLTGLHLVTSQGAKGKS